MSRDKQIEDMARKICPCIYNHNECESCDLYEHESCLPFNIARGLTDYGYRKADEVAREVFSVTDETIEQICAMTGLNITIFGKYAELKKKYTEGE